MGRLEGKVAIVTGAASGIGEAIARRFVNEGAEVLGVDVDPLMAQVQSPSLSGLCADVSCAPGVIAMVDAARAYWGKLDILANVAGIVGCAAKLADLDDDEFDRVLQVNVRGPYLGMKHAIPLMLEGAGGSIINMASVGSFICSPFPLAAYSASKGALLMLTKAAAMDYAEAGIRVNAICPGTVATSLAAEGLDEDVRERQAGAHPMGRIASPDEVASMAVFLASDESSFCTGAPFLVDGGRLARG